MAVQQSRWEAYAVPVFGALAYARSFAASGRSGRVG